MASHPRQYDPTVHPMLHALEDLTRQMNQTIEEIQNLRKTIKEKDQEIKKRDDIIESKDDEIERKIDEVLIQEDISRTQRGELAVLYEENRKLESDLKRAMHDDDWYGIPPADREAMPIVATINREEYIKKVYYDKLLNDKQQVAKKYQNVRERERHTKDRLAKEQDRCQRQAVKYAELEQLQKWTLAENTTYMQQHQKNQQWADVRIQTIRIILQKSQKANRAKKGWHEHFEAWKEYLLNKGVVEASDFKKFPVLVEGPDIEIPLNNLLKGETNFKSPAADDGMPPPQHPASAQVEQQQSTVSPFKSKPTELKIESPLVPNPEHPQAPPETPTRRSTYEDPDLTSDEEPESALENFSPTTRAIMRQPGAETLAILHPEIFPSSPEPIVVEERVVKRQEPKGSPIYIKSEPNSEVDWYGKYGYNRMLASDQDSIDLDNVPGAKLAKLSQQDKTQNAKITKDTTDSGSMRTVSQDEGRQQLQKRLSTLSEEQTQESTEVGNSQTDASTPVGTTMTTAKTATTSHYDMVDYTQPPPAPEAREPLQQIPEPNKKVRSNIPDNGKPELSTEKSRAVAGPHTREATGPTSASLSRKRPASKKTKAQKFEQTAMALGLRGPNGSVPKQHLSTTTQQDKLPLTDPPSGGEISVHNDMISKSTRSNTSDATMSGDEAPTRAKTAEPSTASAKRRSMGPPEAVPISKRSKTAAAEAATSTPTPTSKSKATPSDNPFSPSKYRINPAKNDGYDYAFTEVVRENSKKKCLASCVKECCKDLASGKLHEMWQPPKRFEAPRFAANSSPPPASAEAEQEHEEEEYAKKHSEFQNWRIAKDKSERALEYGRHKAQHEKAAEPLHFWDSDFPTDTQLKEQREDSERRYREKGWKMHEEAKKGGMFVRKD